MQLSFAICAGTTQVEFSPPPVLCVQVLLASRQVHNGDLTIHLKIFTKSAISTFLLRKLNDINYYFC